MDVDLNNLNKYVDKITLSNNRTKYDIPPNAEMVKIKIETIQYQHLEELGNTNLL